MSLHRLLSTASNTELSELFGPHRVPWRELSESSVQTMIYVQKHLTEFSQNSPRLPQNSMSSLFRNSTIGNSRITFHHFIFRELFLVIISFGLHRKILAELFLVICRICISCLTSSLQATYVIITSENSGELIFVKISWALHQNILGELIM